jgi:hypothetical protein
MGTSPIEGTTQRLGQLRGRVAGQQDALCAATGPETNDDDARPCLRRDRRIGRCFAGSLGSREVMVAVSRDKDRQSSGNEGHGSTTVKLGVGVGHRHDSGRVMSLPPQKEKGGSWFV